MTIGVDDDESAFSRMDDSKAVEESWLRICSKLKGEVGEVEYRTWLTKIALGPIDGDEITLLLPTRFLRDWVRSQYGDRLSELWNQEISSIRRVELQVARPGDPVAPPSCWMNRSHQQHLRWLLAMTRKKRRATHQKSRATLSHRWIHALRLIRSSSASRMNLPMPAHGVLQKNHPVSGSIRCFFTAVWAWAKRT